MTANGPVHRFAGLLDDARQGFVDPPKGEKEREQFWNDSVFDTLAALRSLLRSKNEYVVLESAKEILSLERTKMRHNKRIDGTGSNAMSAEEFDEERMRTLGPPTMSTATFTPKDTGKPKPAAVSATAAEEEEFTMTAEEAAACDAHLETILITSESIAKELMLKKWKPLTREHGAMFLLDLLDELHLPATKVDSATVVKALRSKMQALKAREDAQGKGGANPANAPKSGG